MKCSTCNEDIGAKEVDPPQRPAITDWAFLKHVFEALAFDHCEDLWWRTDGEYAPLTLFVNCSDIFYWACADSERLTPDNIHILESAVADCKAVNDHVWAPVLFCARVRGMRPQGAVLKDMKPEVRALFEAVAESRPVDFANPYNEKGEYAYKKNKDAL